jgi:hypothetical protein
MSWNAHLSAGFRLAVLCDIFWVLSRLPGVSSSGGLLDDERLLFSTGSWHRLQRKRVPFESACYYNHDQLLPYGCQYNVSQSVEWQTQQSEEKGVLQDFYTSLDGPNWRTFDNWNVGDQCWDAWYGITCDEMGHVISIDLVDNKLNGTIPPSINQLRYLLKLDISTSDTSFHNHPNLYRNKVTGKIPSLASISRLEELAFSANQITGLPPDLYLNGDTLRVLSGSYNRLTELPRYMDRYVRLHTLELDHNEIVGPLPPDLGYLTVARHIHLDVNLLSGPVPNTLKKLTRILNFDVSHNPALTGEMSEDLIVNWAEVEYLAILNTTITGYISSLCLDVPFCWKFMLYTQGFDMGHCCRCP